MTIKVGDTLPDATLTEYVEVEGNGCSIGPNAFKVADLVKGKKIAVFGLPGAFTPTCSAQHVPSYVAQNDALKAKGIDEVWCISVNDAFVMGAWGRDQKAGGKVRMMGDGSADSPRSSASSSTSPPAAWACVASASRWSSTTAPSRSSTSRPRQVRGLRRRGDAQAALS